MRLPGGLSGAGGRIGLDRLGQVLVWGAPPIVIPALRYFQDPPESRDKLFVRDFSTYSLGAALYGTGFAAMWKLLKTIRPAITEPRRGFFALVAGLGVNLLYAGLGAVAVSDWAERRLRPASNQSPAINPATRPAFDPQRQVAYPAYPFPQAAWGTSSPPLNLPPQWQDYALRGAYALPR